MGILEELHAPLSQEQRNEIKITVANYILELEAMPQISAAFAHKRLESLVWLRKRLKEVSTDYDFNLLRGQLETIKRRVRDPKCR